MDNFHTFQIVIFLKICINSSCTPREKLVSYTLLLQKYLLPTMHLAYSRERNVPLGVFASQGAMLTCVEPGKELEIPGVLAESRGPGGISATQFQ